MNKEFDYIEFSKNLLNNKLTNDVNIATQWLNVNKFNLEYQKDYKYIQPNYFNLIYKVLFNVLKILYILFRIEINFKHFNNLKKKKISFYISYNYKKF